MLSPYVQKLRPASKARMELAYNDKRRPISYGEPDDVAVSMLQVWLFVLGFKMSKSVKQINPDRFEADGLFWDETRDAVIAFQTKFKLKVDGLVGHDTLDMFWEQLPKYPPHPPMTRNASVTVVPKNYHCPPGVLICKDPDTH